MNEVATIHFVDDDTGDEAAAIVRAEEGRVGLTLSLRTNGDVMVVIGLEDSERLLTALEQAILIARQARQE